ncbi:MAG: hypothetical protein JWL81_2296 [Verrucomicrobiales bacterium]|nr:hypothetical protein [Verrucomicrobiales bacterium]
MNQPQNLPEVLQARLRLGLFNWGKRTIIGTTLIGLISTRVPFFKLVLIAWIVFSLFSLAALLLGMKLAKHLKTGTFSAFPQGGQPEPRDVGGDRPDHDPEPEIPHSHHPGARHSNPTLNDEIIEIEAEVLPPEKTKS